MTTKSKDRIRSMDMPIIDKVFAMESGGVLNFGNRTFAEFFREELGVNIDHSRWAVQGDSKAKRPALLFATGGPAKRRSKR